MTPNHPNKKRALNFAVWILIRSILAVGLLNSCVIGQIQLFEPDKVSQVYAPWSYASLRLLDSVDSPNPTQDLLALYTRSQFNEFQIRLDLLEHAPQPNFDLYIAIDQTPGGERALPISAQALIDWDILLIIPADGKLQTLKPNLSEYPRSAMRIIRDPVFDTVQISLRQDASDGIPSKRFGSPLQIQVFLTAPGSDTVIDQLGPVSSDSASPPPARVIFAFWNSFPAYSPALSLRRWDGAHTGPFGGRHGLFNLLRTATAANIPLFLLDMKAPASLVALEHMGSLDLIRDLQATGKLILPEYVPDFPAKDDLSMHALANSSVAHSRDISNQFDLSTSQFIYAPIGFLPTAAQTKMVFARYPDIAKDQPLPLALQRVGGIRLVLLPIESTLTQQAAYDGPTLETRKALINTAIQAATNHLNPSQDSFLILGGDLPSSAWGDPQAARATFKYLNAHPWIKPLSSYDLLSARTTDQTIPTPSISKQPLPADLLTELQFAPKNSLSNAAWQTLHSLYGPIYPISDKLPIMRAHYLSGVWSLLHAARWADSPTAMLNCRSDPDKDGQPECILASEQVYAQFEIDDGSLTYAFTNLGEHPGEIHQFIAPSSQFVIGLSQPGGWDISRGLSADPEVFTGAFPSADLSFGIESSNDTLLFYNPMTGASKRYHLTTDGISAEFTFQKAETLIIPLVIDPWSRFRNGWSYAYSSENGNNFFRLMLDDILTVILNSSTSLSVDTFNDSIELFNFPENPNRDVPPGHRLPYPLIVIKSDAVSQASIEFRIQQDTFKDIIGSND